MHKEGLELFPKCKGDRRNGKIVGGIDPDTKTKSQKIA